ncbi:MAG TPA: class I SAM-dependent methyltransferase [Burkholderiales bacterium]|nr:class I SAM-dependent methyltransferase [Burkholderiales bacterium]
MMSRTTNALPDSIYQYLCSVSLREPAVLAELREVTRTLPRASMQLSPEEGQFIGLLIRMIGARKCLEVGVFTGYSSTCIASAMPPEGRLIACDVNDEWTAIARRFWDKAGVADRIDLRLGPGIDILDALLAGGHAGTFDFAFIDADKGNYLNYYERALKLVRSGGLVAIDNTLWYGKPADPGNHDPDTEAIREVNRRVHADMRVTMSLVPIGDGLTLALKA